MPLDDLKRILKREEGLRLRPYLDTVNKLTIGYGRNLSDKGISASEAEALLENDIHSTLADCVAKVPGWDMFDDTVQTVLAAMAFQLGINGLLKFKKTLKLLRRGDRQAAAVEMRKSKWAEQTPARAERMARLLEI